MAFRLVLINEFFLRLSLRKRGSEITSGKAEPFRTVRRQAAIGVALVLTQLNTLCAKHLERLQKLRGAGL